MSQSYEQYFKKAKATKDKAKGRQEKMEIKGTPKTEDQGGRKTEEDIRSMLKISAKTKKSKNVSLPVLPLLFALLGVGVAFYGYTNISKVEALLGRIEVEVFGDAQAAEGSTKQENSSSSKVVSEAKSADVQNENTKTECTEVKGFTEEELSHFNKLNERKKELDRRDMELTALEEELHKQRIEVEERIGKLDKIREEVASVLKDRVEVDQQKVSVLVDFYTNMKPKQAADIFTNLNEDLAVEVLGKMKKKSAAEILNLIEPAKARTLSEKFTGYKRR